MDNPSPSPGDHRTIRSQRSARQWWVALLVQLLAGLVVLALVVATNQLRLSFGWTIMTLAIAQGLLSAVIAWRVGSPRWWFWIHLFFWPAIVAVSTLHWPPWIYLSAFLLLCLVYWSTYRTRVPFFLTNRQTLESLVIEIEKARPMRLVDLGCASGLLLRRLSDRFPDIEMIGFEIAPIPFALAKWRLRNRPNARVYYKDFWKVDLGGYDFVYAFLSDEPMAQLWEKLCQEMRPSTTFVSNSFAVPGVEPDRKVVIDDFRGTELLIWQMAGASDREDVEGDALASPQSDTISVANPEDAKDV